MAAIIATAQNYWISTSALTITLNALGEANRVQASVASGAQIMCYIRGVDGLDFDEGHNYRRWPLTVSPTFFNTNTEKYLYVVIPRTTAIGTQAMVWFPSVKLDVYGCAIDEEGEPAEQVGNPDYYYIWLQGIISSSGASGNTPRTWQQQPQTGTLATDEAINPAGGEWYRWDAISQTVTFLKDIWMDAASTFRNLILGGKTLTGVAVDDTTPADSTTHVVTPAYLRTQYSNKYIRKDQDDSTPYNLGVEQSLNVGKDLAVDGDATIVGTTRANVVQSDNYTGDGVADTGYRLTKDDGTGSSKLTVDNLYVRKKATFEELEVRKETAIAGNQIYSSAANIILRTDYFDANGQLMGYSTIVVPYLLKRVPFLLRMLSRASRTGFFGRERRLRMFLEAEDIPNIRRVRCYFLAKDDDRTIDNLWQCNEQGADMARCQTMNLHNSNRSTYIHGMETKLGNIYWWRKLCGVSSKPVTIDGDDREYHYFDVMFNYNAEQQYRQQGQQCPWADVASGDIPCAGDHVVQFGNDLNPDRMNLIAVEVNSSSDAPAHKWYRGIYTFDLSRCWWGGNPRKDMISAASGVEFYGPSFKVQTEYGIAKVPKDRDEVNWSDIATQRDDYGEHPDVRKCYSYDAITHGGCRWLCLLPDGAHWVCPQQWDDDTYALFDANGNYRHNGNYITNTQYDALTTDQKSQCGRIPNYTTVEPGTQAAEGVWKKIVDKGANSIRIDLDNENDTMLYSSTKGLVSGNVYSHGSLMDGTTDVTAAATWAIVAAGCTATISGSTVTVTAMSAATGSVMVRATYNGQTYEKELTLKRIVDGDKFELIISPNSIAYNITSDSPATSTLAIQVWKTACDGTRALSAPPSGYQVYANGTQLTATATGTYSYTTDNSAISEVAVKIATTASATDSLDAETIPINKAANGANGANAVRIDLDNENDTMLYSSSKGLVSGNVTSTAHLYDGTSDVSASATWSIQATNCTATISNRVITVTAMSAATGSVTVSAQYNGKTYTAILTLKKILDADKFDLVVTPNSIAYNSTTDTPATSTLAIQVWKTACDGTRALSAPPSGYDVYANGNKLTASSTGTYSYTTDNSAISEVTVKIATSASATDSLDAETIPVNKAANGPQGDDGDDGWTIIANPANVILTQSLSTTSSFSTATVSFSAKKGSRTASFYLTGLTEGNFNCEKPSGTETIRVLSPKSNDSSYYTEGYFEITINATDPDTNSIVTFTVRVLCYANLLGSWKHDVEDGEERIAAQKISYALNNGDTSKTIEQSKTTFNSVRNSAESFQQWQNDTSGVAGTYQYINTHLTTAEQNISKMDAKIPTKNLLDCASGDGWRNWYDDSDANYNNATQLIGSTASDANQIDVYSKPVFLKSGVQYVVSLYSHTSPTLKIFKLNGNPNAKVDDFNGNHAEVLTVYSTTTTYQGCTRYYAVFTLSSSYGNDDYVLDVFGSLKYFYRPMIEVGNSPTDWVPGSTNQTSEIRQTADEISAKVGECGIDITNKTITLNAEKTIVTGELTVPRVMNMANGMMTTIEAGKVRIESTTTQSYGLFQVNSDGEIVLKMVDKDGHVVANVGGSSQMTAGSWEQIKLKRVDSDGYVADMRANFTANASDLTTYYKLTLGRVDNGGLITYYLPNGDVTIDSAVISLDGYLFTSYSDTAAGIKALSKVGGYYVRQNNGIFMQDVSLSEDPGPYIVPVYQYISGKQDNITTHSFTS